MRYALLLIAGLLLFSTGARAQTNSAPQGDDRQARMIGFLSPADQDRVMNAYNKALANNAILKSEADNLMLQAQDLQGATPEVRQAFMEKLRSHQEKVRKAMLKEDPSLTPVLNKIDKHISQLRAQRQKEMGGTSSGQ
jgi:hypothetical protein